MNFYEVKIVFNDVEHRIDVTSNSTEEAKERVKKFLCKLVDEGTVQEIMRG